MLTNENSLTQKHPANKFIGYGDNLTSFFIIQQQTTCLSIWHKHLYVQETRFLTLDSKTKPERDKYPDSAYWINFETFSLYTKYFILCQFLL